MKWKERESGWWREAVRRVEVEDGSIVEGKREEVM